MRKSEFIEGSHLEHCYNSCTSVDELFLLQHNTKHNCLFAMKVHLNIRGTRTKEAKLKGNVNVVTVSSVLMNRIMNQKQTNSSIYHHHHPFTFSRLGCADEKRANIVG